MVKPHQSMLSLLASRLANVCSAYIIQACHISCHYDWSHNVVLCIGVGQLWIHVHLLWAFDEQHRIMSLGLLMFIMWNCFCRMSNVLGLICLDANYCHPLNGIVIFENHMNWVYHICPDICSCSLHRTSFFVLQYVKMNFFSVLKYANMTFFNYKWYIAIFFPWTYNKAFLSHAAKCAWPTGAAKRAYLPNNAFFCVHCCFLTTSWAGTSHQWI